MKRIGRLRFLCFSMVLLPVVIGCGDDENSPNTPLVPNQDVNSAVQAALGPVGELMENGEDASTDDVVFDFSGGETAEITYSAYLCSPHSCINSSNIPLQKG